MSRSHTHTQYTHTQRDSHTIFINHKCPGESQQWVQVIKQPVPTVSAATNRDALNQSHVPPFTRLLYNINIIVHRFMSISSRPYNQLTLIDYQSDLWREKTNEKTGLCSVSLTNTTHFLSTSVDTSAPLSLERWFFAACPPIHSSSDWIVFHPTWVYQLSSVQSWLHQLSSIQSWLNQQSSVSPILAQSNQQSSIQSWLHQLSSIQFWLLTSLHH